MLSREDAAQIARDILHPAPQRPEASLAEARAAGASARAASSDRVAAPYRAWDLQRAFIAGWKDADAAASTRKQPPEEGS